MKAADWIIINVARGGRYECQRCGGHYQPAMPASINVLSAMAEGFARDHRSCKPHKDGAPCPHCEKRGHDPDHCPQLTRPQSEVEWWHGTDTGLSSKCIWLHMRGGTERKDHPLDPDDFGRCYRLLKLFPAWRKRIREMGEVSPQWRRLAKHWRELERLYEQELPTGTAPRLYARMQELIR